MAFPSSLDTFTAIPSGNAPLSTGSHTDVHTEVKSALEALEAKVGINGSAVNTSLDFLLKSTSGGHDHDGSDSKKVLVTNLDPTGLSAGKLLKVNAGGTGVDASSLAIPTSDFVGKDDTQTLTNKTLTSPVINTPTGDVATKTGTETLTNKTLTSPIVNTPTINTPTIKTWDGWESVTDSWSYSSADGPIGIVTVPSGAASLYSVGMRVKFTQTTVKYFIIHAVTDTTLTLYGGTDYTLANAAISSISYSAMKAPLGFNPLPSKWREVYTDTSDRTPAASSTYAQITNAQLDMPIGSWIAEISISLKAARAASGTGVTLDMALSTATNSASSAQMVWEVDATYSSGTSGTANLVGVFTTGVQTVASKTTYYLIHKESTTTAVTVTAKNSVSTLTIRFISAYL